MQVVIDGVGVRVGDTVGVGVKMGVGVVAKASKETSCQFASWVVISTIVNFVGMKLHVTVAVISFESGSTKLETLITRVYLPNISADPENVHDPEVLSSP